MKNVIGTIGLFNNSLDLWVGARPAHRAENKILLVVDGHIHVSGDGWVARCASQSDAIKLLIDAGYSRVGVAANSFVP